MLYKNFLKNRLKIFHWTGTTYCFVSCDVLLDSLYCRT